MVDPVREVARDVRDIRRLIAEGRPDVAVDRAEQLLSEAGPDLSAEGRGALSMAAAEAAHADGDFATAATRAGQAAALASDPRRRWEARREEFRSLRAQPERLGDQVAAAERLVAIGRNDQDKSNLTWSLVELGDVNRSSGDLTTATTLYTEALDLARRRIDLYGQTPDTLNDLSVALERGAMVEEPAPFTPGFSTGSGC